MFGLLLLLATSLPAAAPDTPILSQSPVYEMSLPATYTRVTPEETPPRYVRPRGREILAMVNVVIASNTNPLTQNRSGVKAEDVLSVVPLPPDAKWTFAPMKWKGFDVGAFEYHAVVKSLPVFGLAIVLPLADGTLTILAYAAEPLEKECREEFADVLSRVTRAPTNWHSAEHFQKVETLTRVGLAGVVLLALYPIVWAIAFRGFPMRAHWLRTGWLVTAALLLFAPINSPGEMTLLCNLLVNAVLPVVLLLFAARRIKLAVED